MTLWSMLYFFQVFLGTLQLANRIEVEPHAMIAKVGTSLKATDRFKPILTPLEVGAVIIAVLSLVIIMVVLCIILRRRKSNDGTSEKFIGEYHG